MNDAANRQGSTFVSVHAYIDQLMLCLKTWKTRSPKYLREYFDFSRLNGSNAIDFMVNLKNRPMPDYLMRGKM